MTATPGPRPNRAERRRRQRLDRKRKDAAARAGQPMIAAQGHEFRSTGQLAEASGLGRPLPDKVDGQHRWIASTIFAIAPGDASAMFDADRHKFLDHENLVDIILFCWDCETALDPTNAATACPAPAADG